jgi:pSer/pThr/pTyr-binding forkhead associated (FHA) protein
MPQQFILKRIDDGTETPVTDQLIAGRAAGCGLLLPKGGPGGGTSRRHARLLVRDGALWVEDLGSKNGTFINGIRLEARKKALLQPGDRLRFDQIELAVFSPGGDNRSAVMGMPATEVRWGPIHAPSTSQSRPGRMPPVAVEAADASVKKDDSRKSSGLWADIEGQLRKGVNALADGVIRRVRPAPRKLPGAYAPTQEGRKTTFIARKDPRSRIGGPLLTLPASVTVPTLHVKSGSLAGGRFELRGQRDEVSTWTIGFDSDRSVVLPDQGISGEHAAIVNEGDRWKIIDQLSTCGTFVNGRRTSNSFLASGDELGFGPDVTCVFQLPPPSAREAAGQGARRIDATTVVVSVLLVAALILTIWLYLPVLKAHMH